MNVFISIVQIMCVLEKTASVLKQALKLYMMDERIEARTDGWSDQSITKSCHHANFSPLVTSGDKVGMMATLCDGNPIFPWWSLKCNCSGSVINIGPRKMCV